MYAVGDYLYISWNQNRKWGDSSIRKYEVNKMLSGVLEQVSGKGMSGGNQVTYLYGNKLFYIESNLKSLTYIDTETDATKTVMNLHDPDIVSSIKAIRMDDNYLYLCKEKEIFAYKT